ncbi:MAG: hypothetical protein R3C01_06435 [Planctomycetaceae bacterium]
MVDKKHESEEQLIERAQRALSSCNWEIGECASKWTQRHAKGRTDADFGSLIGLSGDQVYQRRRVWEGFADVYENYAGLRWSHFYAALNWDDAAECLQWSSEMGATVAEMKAWRRAQHGEDLLTVAEGDDEGEFLSYDAGFVQMVDGEPVGSGASGAMRGEGGSGSREATASSFAREADGSGSDDDESYAPFGNGSRGDAPTSAATKAAPSTAMLIRRAAKMLKGLNAQLTPEVLEAFHESPADVQQEFLRAIDDLSAKSAGLR